MGRGRSDGPQLSELVNVENYGEWIQLVAEFTIKSLQSWQWASGSVYYLLGLWSRLVSSMPYLKGDSPSLLEGYRPPPRPPPPALLKRRDPGELCPGHVCPSDFVPGLIATPSVLLLVDICRPIGVCA